MATTSTGLVTEAKALLADGEDVLKVLEDVDTLPGLDKFAKYVNDAQALLNKLVAFVAAT